MPSCSSITQTVGVDPALLGEPSEALEKATTRARKLGLDLRGVGGVAEELPFESGSFDAVVSTLVFCSVRDPAAALKEVRWLVGSAPGSIWCGRRHGLIFFVVFLEIGWDGICRIACGCIRTFCTLWPPCVTDSKLQREDKIEFKILVSSWRLHLNHRGRNVAPFPQMEMEIDRPVVKRRRQPTSYERLEEQQYPFLANEIRGLLW